jgi:acylphosphatase
MATRFLVHGRVQGVGYRYFVLREAEALGLTGFVRNLPDASVEVVADALPETLRAFENRLAQGPAFADVESVTSTQVPPLKMSGFSIR